MQKVKNFFIELIMDAHSKWREVLAILLFAMLDIFVLSSLITRMPVWGIVLTVLCLGLPALFLIGWCIKDKHLDKQDYKFLTLFLVLALLLGPTKSWLYISSLLLAIILFDKKEDMYKWMFLITGFCFFTYMLLVLFHLIPDLPLIREDDGVIANVRHTFGFLHPNHPMKYLFACTIFGYLWKGDNKYFKWSLSAVVLALAIFIGHNTNSRTGTLMMCGLVLIMNLPILVRWIKTKYVYIIGIGLTIILILCHNVKFINDALTTRPQCFYKYIVEKPQYILLGKYYLVEAINFLINGPRYVLPLDNDYLMIVFDGGLITLGLIVYLFYKVFKNNEDEKTKVSLIALTIYGLTEAFCFTNIYPLFLILFVEMLELYFKNKDKIKMFKSKKEIIEKEN